MEKSKIKFNFNINNGDENFTYIWNEFKSRPNKIKLHAYLDKKATMEIISEYEIETSMQREIIPADDFNIKNDTLLSKLQDEIFISYTINDSDSDESLVSDITIYYKSVENLPFVDNIIKGLDSIVIGDEFEIEEPKLNTLSINNGSIGIEEVAYEIDEHIEMFYTDGVLKSVNKLSKLIKKSEGTLSIFYGNKGTGKTSAAKYLADKLNISIYIPNNLLESTINNAEFKSFLVSYKDSLIIIDDCENIFNNYYSKSNIYTNNILQLLEGITAISSNFLMIFNSDLEEIDDNLLECNSFLKAIEFKNLEIDEANKLSKHLGNKKKVKISSRLIDVIKNVTDEKVEKIGLN